MFCPQCGSTQSDEVKFCKSCGANLQAVQQVMSVRETGETIDWSKTWVAEMFMSAGERQRRAEELERQRGITPEVKRYNEIKAGVITGSVGLAIAVFLYVFMQGVVLGGKVPHDTAEIISRLWVAGVIPLFVGLALIVNGLFVSRKLVEISKRGTQSGPHALGRGEEPRGLRPADTTEFVPAGFSVTEETTKHLSSHSQKPQTPNNP